MQVHTIRLLCTGLWCCNMKTATGRKDACMLQEHPSSAGSALDHLTAGYAGAGIKARNGTAQALRALAPLLGEPQVRSIPWLPVFVLSIPARPL
jgi:hypothetical protein